MTEQTPTFVRDDTLRMLCSDALATDDDEEEADFHHTDVLWCELSFLLGKCVADLQSRIFSQSTRQAIANIDFDKELNILLEAAIQFLEKEDVAAKRGKEAYEDIITHFSIASRGSISGMVVQLKEREATMSERSFSPSSSSPSSRKRPREEPSTSFTVKISQDTPSSNSVRSRKDGRNATFHDASSSEPPRKLTRTDSRWITEDPQTGELCITLQTGGGGK